jgi:hypothetical protein
MLFTWMEEGRSLADIVQEWQRITGQGDDIADDSTLSVRHLYLQEYFANSSREFVS